MPHRLICLSTIVAAVLGSMAAARQAPLPRVVLVGDSIRMGYAPLVAKRLEGKAVVISAQANGEDTANVLKNLDEWVIKEQPAVVHLNAGLHDLKVTDQKYQVTLADYEKNLNTILERIRTGTKAKVIFATSTPILDDLHARRKVGFDRFDADVQKYNATALSVMKRAGVPVNDLHKAVEDGGKAKIMAADGTHYTPQGYEMLAAIVADSIIRALK